LTDAERPAVKTDGTLYWLDRPGTENLKLWLPGGITGATLAYADDSGTTIQTGQTVADGAELLLSSRIYALVLIDRALTTPETDDLTAWLDAARTTGLAGYSEPASTPAGYTYLGQITSTDFRARVDGGGSPYRLKAVGANSAEVEYDAETASGPATTRDLSADGLTAPVDIYVDSDVFADAAIDHLAFAPNGMDGGVQDVSAMTGLTGLYIDRNPGMPIWDVTGLNNLLAYWAQGNNAEVWPATSMPPALTELRLNDNSLPESEVDKVLAQAAAVPLSGATIDVSGGTNANASATGWGAKDTLEANSCIIQLAGTDPRTSSPSNFVWKPGHYITLHWEEQEALDYISYFDANGGAIRGITRVAKWVELEASKDNYDALYFFLDRWMNVCSSGNDWGLCLRYMIRGFSSNVGIFPAYMQDPEYLYYDGYGEVSAAIWHPFVQERMIKMAEQIA